MTFNNNKLYFQLDSVNGMDSSGEQNFDLSEYRVMSIEDNHKLAIVNLINGIVPDPILEDMIDVKSSVFKLGQLTQLFDDSFITSGIDQKTRLQLPQLETLEDTQIGELSAYIRNWLISYYNADSLIESLKLEDGIPEEISMAALLILNTFRQLKDSLPDIREELDKNWIHLCEFDDQLESMWKTDKAFSLLQTELECERIQRLADKQKLTKLEKEVNSYKRKVKQSKEMLEKLKKFASKPAPKSKKRGGSVYTPTATRGRGGRRGGRSGIKYEPPEDDDVEADVPPLPGTPVLLSSSGTGSSCRYCGKWFNDAIKLNKHLVVHAGSKPFACDWPGCGRPFDSNYKLQRHRRCHTGERPFGCDTCGKRFTRSDKLREHQKLHLRDSARKESALNTSELNQSLSQLTDEVMEGDVEGIEGTDENGDQTVLEHENEVITAE